uniref:Reverse transcriptase domain-containing protein n=1 Tax=Angiostrongylus cantonensis TaxID=6313 RepID=A0A0K0CTT6_ANGCA
MEHIHTITKLVEVSREYKRPHCLTFIDLRKAFDSLIEVETIMETFDCQAQYTVRYYYYYYTTQYINIFRELYKNFTTKISPFSNDINVDVKRGWQGGTISPKLRTATLQNVIIRTLEWDNMAVKIDGRQLHHLLFADDIVLITPNIA